MNTFVYCLHYLIVLGVPTLFGWVLLRRVFREASWLVLAPGAVVAGFVALMATVNELRFFWEMRIAVWSAYKLLLALALVLVVALPRRAPRLRLPGCVDRPWQLGLVIAGTIAVGFYYGIPACSGYLNDAWWYHYPAAVQIQTVEHFPLNNVFAVDDPLYYHFGPDILAACWSFLLDLRVPSAWALNIVVLAPCGFLLAFALIARLSRNYWSALFAAVLLIAGGNLRWLFFLTGKFAGAAGALQVFNSQTVQGLLQLIFTPSHLVGIPLSLLVLLLFRHFTARPSWRLGAALGLLLGALTLVAEWYFLPLTAGFVLVLGYGLWRRRAVDGHWDGRRAAIALLPVVVALFWGTFNNTYLSGVFGHFWMHYSGIAQLANIRLGEQYYEPVWAVPNLVPLRFNFAHFGMVPSWESAASSADSFIPILSARFLSEAGPVLLVGIPFGFWLVRRRYSPLALLLAWLAAVSALPPVFLDWGYRSTDFLRFFTASYCYAALLLGWLIGVWLVQPGARRRWLAGALAVSTLITPIGLGICGLIPGTIDRVKAVADTAQSLSQLSHPTDSSPAQQEDTAARHKAFEKLAVTTGDYLFLYTKGRERAIVVVPVSQVPEVKYFQEWMKMATYSRILLPIGWHWQESLYSAYYRDAVARLDARAITALDAKWVISSNLFQETLPEAVAEALKDPRRFVQAAQFHEGRYYMTVYKVHP